MTGTIFITLEGATFEQTERCRAIINILFNNDIFSIRNGSVTLHFDYEGTLNEIEINVKKWKRNKPDLPLLKSFENAIIQTQASTQTPRGQAISA